MENVNLKINEKEIPLNELMKELSSNLLYLEFEIVKE